VRELYSFAVKPISPSTSACRSTCRSIGCCARRVKLKFYEAGMDMVWSANAVESFRIFQGKVSTSTIASWTSTA
jgi:hypothetical protein